MRTLRSRPTPPSLRMPPALKYSVGKVGKRSKRISTTTTMASAKPLRMRAWLETLLDNNECKGLAWVDREKKTFEITWCHASRHDFDTKEHADLFIKYAEFTGRRELLNDSKGYNSKLKSNFRSALNSLIDCIEVKDCGIGRVRGENAVKVFQFIDPSHPEYKRKKELKANNQRNSKRTGASKSKIKTETAAAVAALKEEEEGEEEEKEEKEVKEEEDFILSSLTPGPQEISFEEIISTEPHDVHAVSSIPLPYDFDDVIADETYDQLSTFIVSNPNAQEQQQQQEQHHHHQQQQQQQQQIQEQQLHQHEQFQQQQQQQQIHHQQQLQQHIPMQIAQTESDKETNNRNTITTTIAATTTTTTTRILPLISTIPHILTTTTTTPDSTNTNPRHTVTNTNRKSSTGTGDMSNSFSTFSSYPSPRESDFAHAVSELNPTGNDGVASTNAVTETTAPPFDIDYSALKIDIQRSPSLPNFSALDVDDTFDPAISLACKNLYSGGSMRVRKEKQTIQTAPYPPLRNVQPCTGASSLVQPVNQDYNTHRVIQEPDRDITFAGTRRLGRVIQHNGSVTVVQHDLETISQGENYNLLNVGSMNYSSSNEGDRIGM